MTKNVLK
jgi:hypothetical protein